MGQKRIVTINPLNRVEGDLEVKVEIKDGRVVDACSSGVAFRGFERLLLKRDPMDALVFTCRVCGICSISHSTASSIALRNAFNARMEPNAYFIRNVVLAAEILMNHLLHFYALFMIDFTNKKYSKRSDYKEIVKRFSFLRGTSYIRAMKARKDFLAFLGLFIGKWPNTLALQPGGITKAINTSEIARALAVLSDLRDFIENDLLGCEVESFLEINDVKVLNKWVNEHVEKDLGLFLSLAEETGLKNLGKGIGRFISCGGYELPDGTTWYKSGYYDDKLKPFQQEKIAEDIRFSYFEDYEGSRHPFAGSTEPNAEKKVAYSWIKAPRYNGKVVEVGPIARMVINKFPFVTALMNDSGINVYTRSLARVYEILVLLKRVEEWIKEIDPEKPFYIIHEKSKNAKGFGIIEAARGILGHWINIENNKIKSYQIITPTAWNMSPKDSDRRPGAAEQALIGTPIEDEKNPVEIGHVIRSFDPCLFCSVHVMKGKGIRGQKRIESRGERGKKPSVSLFRSSKSL